MEVKQRYFFRRHQKLKRRKDIDYLMKKGKRFSNKNYRVFYEFFSDELGVKTAIGCSSKIFKKAAHRNKIKRLMREAFRLQLPDLTQHLKNNQRGTKLFILFTGKEAPNFKEVNDDFLNMMSRIMKLSDENMETLA